MGNSPSNVSSVRNEFISTFVNILTVTQFTMFLFHDSYVWLDFRLPTYLGLYHLSSLPSVWSPSHLSSTLPFPTIWGTHFSSDNRLRDPRFLRFRATSGTTETRRKVWLPFGKLSKIRRFPPDRHWTSEMWREGERKEEKRTKGDDDASKREGTEEKDLRGRCPTPSKKFRVTTSKLRVINKTTTTTNVYFG